MKMYRSFRNVLSLKSLLTVFILTLLIMPGCSGGGGGGDSADDGDDKDIFFPSYWYKDSDGDGYGDPSISTQSQDQPFGYVSNKFDCDDNDQTINPGAYEVCSDNTDNDCDGFSECSDSECFEYIACQDCTDTDGDGFFAEFGCAGDVDCHDGNETINPNAIEICGDGIDQDCNGTDLACPINDISLEYFGNLHVTEDYDGNIKILGEIVNNGNTPVNFVKVIFTFYDNVDQVIDSDYTYAYGTCMTLSASGDETTTAFMPGNIGGFKLYTTIKAENVGSYSSTFSYRTYEMQHPVANLIIVGEIMTSNSYINTLELSGTVKNNGLSDLINGKVYCVVKNKAKLVIAISFVDIDGKTVWIPSISDTDTALEIGDVGSFNMVTLADYSIFGSYYCTTGWTDGDIDSGVASALYTSSNENRKYIEYWEDLPEKEKHIERDHEIDRLKELLE